MPQVFHPSMNAIARATLAGLLLMLVLLAMGAATVVRSPYFSGVGVVVPQPIEFSHQHHVGEIGIDCRYCHSSVETSSSAGIPPTQTCLNCHSYLFADSPLRLQTPQLDGRIATWGDFLGELQRELAVLAEQRGKGLHVLSEPVQSPTLAAQRDALLRRFPACQWHVWEPLHRDAEWEGLRAVVGKACQPVYHTAEADVVLSLDSDFLVTGAGSLVNTRGFASRRPGAKFPGGTDRLPNRLYTIETSLTLTGAAADHRLAVDPADLFAATVAIARKLGFQGRVGKAPPASGRIGHEWIEAVAEDLAQGAARGGRAVVTAGRWQPAVVHALAHWMNLRLEAVGVTVEYFQLLASEPRSATASLNSLVEALQSETVGTLQILGGDPATNAPAGEQWSSLLRGVSLSAQVRRWDTRTGRDCRWSLPAAHFLESWSDVRGADGTVSMIQPLIEPLYAGKTSHEILSELLGEGTSSYDIVRSHWHQVWDLESSPERAGKNRPQFEQRWRQALHEGVVSGTRWSPLPAELDAGVSERVATGCG